MNKAVFWDFHGTLIRGDSLWSRTVFRVLTEDVKSSGATLDDIRACMKSCFTWDTPDEDFSALVNELWWEHLLSRFARIYERFGVPEKDAGNIARRVRTEIVRQENFIPFEDTAFILNACRSAGFKNYILSNNFPELDSVIESMGLSPLFDGYIISAKVGYDKPRREIFDIARREAGNPAECLMVGDNPRADIEGGRAAGMKTVLVHNGAECGADYAFATLSEIAGILPRMSAE